MTSTIDNLQSRYPKISMDHLREVAIAPGWHPLLHGLLSTIHRHLEDQELNNTSVTKISLIQIKEKFGGLRFYYSGGDDVIHDHVLIAERLSKQTCEECGAEGKVRSDLGWIRTLCDTHHQEALKKS